jgi:2-(1,2-epoxy-1,2-dihydrophenyl)acetyl-CoA isomerase
MAATSSILSERIGSVALIKLNRPAVLNAFDGPMRCALRDTLDEVGRDDAVRAVVLTGEGRLFSAGADLKSTQPTAEQTRAQLLEEYGPALQAIADMPKPVIAAINGPAVGIGLAYALICDLRVMAASAYLQAPFNAIGLLPDGGLSWLLPRALGYARAFAFVTEANRLDASECLSLGLVNRVAPDGQTVADALEWAKVLAAGPAAALAATKRAMRASCNTDYAQALATEADLQAPLVASADFAEGVAAFRATRPPRFTGR